MTLRTNISARLRTFGTLAFAATGLALVLFTQQAGSETGTDMTARNKATILESFEAWAEGKGGPYDLLAEDAEWTITGRSMAARTYSNREAFLSEVIRPFNARMSTPLRPIVREIYADGDAVVVLFLASGTARDGLPYVNTYSWHLYLQEDRIVRATAFFDSIAFNEFWTRVTPAPAEAVALE